MGACELALSELVMTSYESEPMIRSARNDLRNSAATVKLVYICLLKISLTLCGQILLGLVS